jgi:hypothetical protein
MCVWEKTDTTHVRSSRCTILFTQPSTRLYTPIHADIPNTNTRACLAHIPTFIPVHNAISYTMHKRAPLLRIHASRHSLECLECGVVGKFCSNVLHSLRAYGVVAKAVRTCVCEKDDTTHVRSSRCAIPHIQPRARSHTSTENVRQHIKYKHACMPLTKQRAIAAHNALSHLAVRQTHKKLHTYSRTTYCCGSRRNSSRVFAIWRSSACCVAIRVCCVCYSFSCFMSSNINMISVSVSAQSFQQELCQTQEYFELWESKSIASAPDGINDIT